MNWNWAELTTTEESFRFPTVLNQSNVVIEHFFIILSLRKKILSPILSISNRAGLLTVTGKTDTANGKLDKIQYIVIIISCLVSLILCAEN